MIDFDEAGSAVVVPDDPAYLEYVDECEKNGVQIFKYSTWKKGYKG